MTDNLFARKTVASLIAETEKKEHQLKKVLGPVDLTFLGIGAVIGTGIFVLTGVAAVQHAGPAVVLSFVFSGLACAFAALCYAEFASMIPVSGSAYTYAYATLGELFAWIIGWDLILEYAVACIAVSIGWSGYLVNLLRGLGIIFPAWACTPPCNIPAGIIVGLLTTLLVFGIKESSRVNSVIVIIKLAVIGFFIALGFFFVKPDNWSPFMPFGWTGVMTGAAIIFFAYIGFDAVSTTAEEARNPKRDLPIGIIASLVVCTILYIAVAAILTGIVPVRDLAAGTENYNRFVSAPVAYALSFIHKDWASGIISVGAVMGITSVLLVMLLGQPRIFFAMSRDGLLPQNISKVHPRYGTPYRTTIITGMVVAIIAMMVPIGTAAELTNIGTLFAFVLVSAGILILRKTNPEIPRGFKAPLAFVVAPLAILFCMYLMYSLPVITWLRFLAWLNVGLLIYFFYGRTHSRLAVERGSAPLPITAPYLLRFFGVTVLVNGTLFGILAVLAIIGVVGLRSWAEVGMDPRRSLIVCAGLVAAGGVMWVAGRGSGAGK
jgi:APA family basic amino acid/polyamine antiporter